MPARARARARACCTGETVGRGVGGEGLRKQWLWCHAAQRWLKTGRGELPSQQHMVVNRLPSLVRGGHLVSHGGTLCHQNSASAAPTHGPSGVTARIRQWVPLWGR